MGDNGWMVTVVGGAAISVDQLDDLHALPTLNIYVEKREFRDVMDLVAVACELGKSVRQMRRLISAGVFPESVVRKGGKQFWLRATVRDWKKSLLTAPNLKRAASTGRLTKWKDERTIEKEEDRRAARLHPDTLKLIADVREMSSVLACLVTAGRKFRPVAEITRDTPDPQQPPYPDERTWKRWCRGMGRERPLLVGKGCVERA